jgi:alkylation response protein AidB-like acyl-CoA dehydrogenase
MEWSPCASAEAWAPPVSSSELREFAGLKKKRELNPRRGNEMSTETQTKPKGYSFLIEETDPALVTTPEDLTEEHRQFAQTTEEFLKAEFDPVSHDLEKLDRDLLAQVLKKSGEAGLLMVEIPEEYGGMGLDLLSQIVVTERLGRAGGFAVCYGVQTGIGTEPILFFGNEAQKEKWLPKLASGEIIGAYGLTEPGSGSDALAALTRADPTEDGHYILNGSKCFISNGGIADLYTVFAKVNGEEFTAFLVERDAPGFTVGAEEEKMGIKSSSTTTLTLQDVKVPAENIVGEIGKGHKIALNILNLGRLKLGVGVVGGMKAAFKTAIGYGIQRKQFGTRLVDFPLIQQKIAAMTAAIYFSESAGYRSSGDIDRSIKEAASSGHPTPQDQMNALEEFAGECAINKVYDSECLDFVVDEALQIHGGYGFIEEYSAARDYRDARISRIYEGTNEINRMNITGYIFKRAMTGRLALMPAIQKIQNEVLSPLEPFDSNGNPLPDVAEALHNAKRLFLFISGVVGQKFMAAPDKIMNEQEALAWMADMVMEIYALESAYLRALKRARAGDASADKHAQVVRYRMGDSLRLIEDTAKKLVDGFFADDSRRTNLQVIKKFAKWPHVNQIELGRSIAAHAIDREQYPFDIL